MSTSHLSQLQDAKTALAAQLGSAEREAEGRPSSRVNILRVRMEKLVGEISGLSVSDIRT